MGSQDWVCGVMGRGGKSSIICGILVKECLSGILVLIGANTDELVIV